MTDDVEMMLIISLSKREEGRLRRIAAPKSNRDNAWAYNEATNKSLRAKGLIVSENGQAILTIAGEFALRAA